MYRLARIHMGAIGSIASLIAVFALPLSAFGTTTYTWQAADSDWSGAYTNLAHWTPTAAEAPGTWDSSETHRDDIAQFSRSSTDYTVTYPTGVYSNFAGITIPSLSARPARILFDGRDTTLIYPRPKTGTAGMIKNGAFNVSHASLFAFDYNGGAIGGEHFRFKNFLFCVTNEPSETRLEFMSGTFAFQQAVYMLILYGGSVSDLPRVLQVDRDASVTFTGIISSSGMSTQQLIRAKGGYLKMPATVWSVSRYHSGGCEASRDHLVEFSATEGGTFDFGYDNEHGFCFGANIAWGRGDSRRTTVRILADQGTISQPGSGYSVYPGGPGTHEIILRNGSTGTFAGSISMGTVSGSVARVSVDDSQLTIQRGITLGGTSATAVAGGGIATFAATNAYLKLGTIADGNGNSKGILLYNGGVILKDSVLTLVHAKSYVKGVSTYGGTRTFEADNSTLIAPTNASVTIFTGFDTATVGAGGFTIDAPTAVTVEQAFGGTGTLTLKGAGAKTLSGDISCAKVVVSGGAATFTGTVTSEVVSTNGATVSFDNNTSSTYPLAGLTLGSSDAVGYLKVQPNETIYVADGSKVSLTNLSFIVDGGSLTAGQSISLVCGGTLSQAVRDAWVRALVAATFDSGYTWGIREEAVSGGVKLIIEPVPNDLLVIIVPASETDTHTTNITFTAGQTLKLNLGTNAFLNLTGTVGYGKLWQTGGGRTLFSGTPGGFLSGIQIDGGALEFNSLNLLGTRDDSSLAFNGGALVLSGSGTVKGATTLHTSDVNKPMIFNVAGDVTMRFPTIEMGKIVKIGDGCLTLLVDGNQTVGKGVIGYSVESAWTTYDAANGTIEPEQCANIDVSGGSIVLKNTGSTIPTLTLQNAYFSVKRRSSVTQGPLCLKLDHVNLHGSYNWWQDGTFCRGGTDDVPTSFVLTNNSRLAVTRTYLGGVYKHEINQSTYRGNYGIESSLMTDAGSNSETGTWHVVNGSCVEANGIYFRYPTVWVFDNSTLSGCKTDNYVTYYHVPTTLQLLSDNANACQQLTFKNNSTMMISYIGDNSNTSTSTRPDSQRVILTFDDSVWDPGDANRTLASSNVWVDIIATGGGLKLNPPSGKVWTLYTPVTGDAGIVKGGEGTLFIDRAYRKHKYLDDPATIAYAGRTTVTGGTLKVASGADARLAYDLGGGATLDFDGAAVATADIAVAGDGTICNATLTRATLRPTYADGVFAQLTLGANAVFDGRTVVDFGRTPENPLPIGIKDAVIARWTGTKPDVRRWRSTNLGIDGYRMSFVACDDGTVTATCVKKPGLVLFIR